MLLTPANHHYKVSNIISPTESTMPTAINEGEKKDDFLLLSNLNTIKTQSSSSLPLSGYVNLITQPYPGLRKLPYTAVLSSARRALAAPFSFYGKKQDETMTTIIPKRKNLLMSSDENQQTSVSSKVEQNDNHTHHITTKNSPSPVKIKQKSLRSLSQHARFSPSRVRVDPKSAIGAVLTSPHNQDVVYRIERVIQTAIYGAVFLASETPVGGSERRRKVALKIMLRGLEKRHKGNLQEDPRAEIQFREQMKGHKNVLVFDHCWEEKDCLFIVMPFAKFEDLFEVLRKRQSPFSESEARWLFNQLFSGADFLHRRGIGFRDHSLENVLMFYDELEKVVVPKITDPGQAVRLQYDETGRIKELTADKLFGKTFRPPEVYNRGSYNPIKVDVFCLGWMLFFAVTKQQAFDKAVPNDPCWKLLIKNKHNELLRQRNGESLTASLTDLLWRMLDPNPKTRYTPLECLAHEWFQGPVSVLDEYQLFGKVPRALPSTFPPRFHLPLSSPNKLTTPFNPKSSLSSHRYSFLTCRQTLDAPTTKQNNNTSTNDNLSRPLPPLSEVPLNSISKKNLPSSPTTLSDSIRLSKPSPLSLIMTPSATTHIPSSLSSMRTPRPNSVVSTHPNSIVSTHLNSIVSTHPNSVVSMYPNSIVSTKPNSVVSTHQHCADAVESAPSSSSEKKRQSLNSTDQKKQNIFGKESLLTRRDCPESPQFKLNFNKQADSVATTDVPGSSLVLENRDEQLVPETGKLQNPENMLNLCIPSTHVEDNVNNKMNIANTLKPQQLRSTVNPGFININQWSEPQENDGNETQWCQDIKNIKDSHHITTPSSNNTSKTRISSSSCSSSSFHLRCLSGSSDEQHEKTLRHHKKHNTLSTSVQINLVPNKNTKFSETQSVLSPSSLSLTSSEFHSSVTSSDKNKIRRSRHESHYPMNRHSKKILGCHEPESKEDVQFNGMGFFKHDPDHQVHRYSSDRHYDKQNFYDNERRSKKNFFLSHVHKRSNTEQSVYQTKVPTLSVSSSKRPTNKKGHHEGIMEAVLPKSKSSSLQQNQKMSKLNNKQQTKPVLNSSAQMKIESAPNHDTHHNRKAKLKETGNDKQVLPLSIVEVLRKKDNKSKVEMEKTSLLLKKRRNQKKEKNSHEKIHSVACSENSDLPHSTLIKSNGDDYYHHHCDIDTNLFELQQQQLTSKNRALAQHDDDSAQKQHQLLPPTFHALERNVECKSISHSHNDTYQEEGEEEGLKQSNEFNDSKRQLSSLSSLSSKSRDFEKCTTFKTEKTHHRTSLLHDDDDVSLLRCHDNNKGKYYMSDISHQRSSSLQTEKLRVLKSRCDSNYDRVLNDIKLRCPKLTNKTVLPSTEAIKSLSTLEESYASKRSTRFPRNPLLHSYNNTVVNPYPNEFRLQEPQNLLVNESLSGVYNTDNEFQQQRQQIPHMNSSGIIETYPLSSPTSAPSSNLTTRTLNLSNELLPTTTLSKHDHHHLNKIHQSNEFDTVPLLSYNKTTHENKSIDTHPVLMADEFKYNENNDRMSSLTQSSSVFRETRHQLRRRASVQRRRILEYLLQDSLVEFEPPVSIIRRLEGKQQQQQQQQFKNGNEGRYSNDEYDAVQRSLNPETFHVPKTASIPKTTMIHLETSRNLPSCEDAILRGKLRLRQDQQSNSYELQHSSLTVQSNNNNNKTQVIPSSIMSTPPAVSNISSSSLPYCSSSFVPSLNFTNRIDRNQEDETYAMINYHTKQNITLKENLIYSYNEFEPSTISSSSRHHNLNNKNISNNIIMNNNNSIQTSPSYIKYEGNNPRISKYHDTYKKTIYSSNGINQKPLSSQPPLLRQYSNESAVITTHHVISSPTARLNANHFTNTKLSSSSSYLLSPTTTQYKNNTIRRLSVSPLSVNGNICETTRYYSKKNDQQQDILQCHHPNNMTILKRIIATTTTPRPPLTTTTECLNFISDVQNVPITRAALC